MSKRHIQSTAKITPPKNNTQFRKLFKKGAALHEKKSYNEALQYLTAAWKFNDDDVDLLIRVADCLFHIDKKNTAMELMAHALQKRPNDPGIASILGNAALKMDFFELSQKFQQHYINLRPNDPVGYNNYASALRENGQFEEAINYLQDILPIFPQSEILWNTLGSVVSFRDGPGHAIVFYEECLKINPNNFQALNNIAPAYASVGKVEQSEISIRKAIEISPRGQNLHMFLSSLLLISKRLKEGWEEYVWRLDDASTKTTIQQNKIPVWNGESLKGKKIFIFGEQGVGDEVLFTWLFQELIDEADHVGIACEPRLVSLFKNSFPQTTVGRYEHRINRKLDIKLLGFPEFDLENFDYQCPTGSLARHKWTDYSNVKPSSKAILTPDETTVKHWKTKINSLPHDISIGVSWRSGVRLAKRARGYASLLDWAPILEQKNINIINIQYGECQDELDEFEQQTGIKIHNFEDLDLKNDFEATTAMLKSLDLVMGPGSAPLMQSNMAGVKTWVFTSGKPWWAFGEAVPIWRQNTKILAKNENEAWSGFMIEKAKDFKEWLKSKK